MQTWRAGGPGPWFHFISLKIKKLKKILKRKTTPIFLNPASAINVFSKSRLSMSKGLTNHEDMWYSWVQMETPQNELSPPKVDESLPSSEELVFPSPPQIKPCSWAECRNGHQWRPTLALVDCQGCGSPSLMAKMENCPSCNEPVEFVSLRHDHVPKGGGVAKRCQGQKPAGESLDIILTRQHWREIEAPEVPKVP